LGCILALCSVAGVALRPLRRPAQRRGGGIFRMTMTWPRAKCPLRGQTESQRNSVHQRKRCSGAGGGSGRAAATPPPSAAQGRRNLPRRPGLATRQVPATRTDRVAAQLCPPPASRARAVFQGQCFRWTLVIADVHAAGPFLTPWRTSEGNAFMRLSNLPQRAARNEARHE
jgi:hypothetical protein